MWLFSVLQSIILFKEFQTIDEIVQAFWDKAIFSMPGRESFNYWRWT